MAQPEPPERMGVEGRATFLSGMRPQDTKRQASKAIMNERNLTGHPSFLERDTLAGEEFFLKTIRHSNLALFFLCALATAQAWAEPGVSAAPAPASPASASWRFGLEAGGTWTPSYAEETRLLSAGGFGLNAYFDLSRGKWIPFHGEIGLFSIGPTAWDDSLFRFRAFWGSRFGIETGYRFPIQPTRPIFRTTNKREISFQSINISN